jgi:hypothetical protein
MTLKYCHSVILYPYQSHVLDNKDIIYHLQFWVLKCIKDICIQEISLYLKRNEKAFFFVSVYVFLYYCAVLFGRDNNSSIISGKKNNRPKRLNNWVTGKQRIRMDNRTKHCRTHHHYSFMLLH